MRFFDIAATFAELGDATSRNLAYSQKDCVRVSYGEETITETNLLEIRRRHPTLVRLQTFSKREESRNGADWEWHIVGRRRTLRMRVQAKRVQRDKVLKIRHEVKSSGKQQRQLLMDGAAAKGMKPVYCIYCTECQRKIWKLERASPEYGSLETGCLLADAGDVPQDTKSLAEIEGKCKPWHYLFAPGVAMFRVNWYVELEPGDVCQFVRSWLWSPPFGVDEAATPADGSGWNAPTADDLNEDTDREFDPAGVRQTNEEDRARLEQDTENGREMARRDEERLRDLRPSRMLVMDVRNDSEAVERGP